MINFAHTDFDKQCNWKKNDSNMNIPDEPQLNTLIGYSDCETCYFRESTLKRIQTGIKQLRGGY